MDDSRRDLLFPAVEGRDVVARFDGGDLTSDAGLVLVRQADRRVGLTQALADAITDRRQQSKVAHQKETLVRERVFAIVQGYEDANDLDSLREDPVLKAACEQRPEEAGVLGSQPTMSRLENAVRRADVYRMGFALARCVVGQLPEHTRTVVMDVDATEDPCHGQQEFKEFNAYYDSHCYLPLQVYVTGPDGVQRVAVSLLRPGKASYEDGLFGVLRRLTGLLRARFPGVRVILRADSGFGNAKVLAFCHAHKLSYVLCVAGNRRLHALSTAVQMDSAVKHTSRFCDTPEYAQVRYKAGTWAKRERVVVKVEVTVDKLHPSKPKLNPRYIVTDLQGGPQAVYAFYCARGDRENRIKESKLDLYSGRTSCHRFLANQCRLTWHTGAQVLVQALQEAASGTRWAKAQAGTLRVRLLKVAARVVTSCRRIWLHLPTCYPEQDVWRRIHDRLCAGP